MLRLLLGIGRRVRTAIDGCIVIVASESLTLWLVGNDNADAATFPTI